MRAPRAAAELPANPFQQLTDEALEAFVDCTLYEDRATSTGPLLDVAQPAPGFEESFARNAPAPGGLRARLSFAEPWVAAGRLREAATRIDRRTAKIIGATVGATALVTLLLSYAMWGGTSEDSVARASAGAPTETAVPAPAAAPGPVVAASVVPVVTPAPCVATVRSEPPGAAVFFGGELAGRTPIDNAAVPCGPSLMAMEKDEYQRIEKRVDARNGKTLFLYNRMSRPPITLDVTTDPPNAKVAVRGRYLGRAPMSTVVPGFIEIEVMASMGGYKPAVTRMVVKPPTANAHLVLEPLKSPGG
ncbi:MAG: PEGA domain-containing protein [Polyangiaceae bacterium]